MAQTTPNPWSEPMGKIIISIVLIIAVWAVFIRDDGALLLRFVDAVAPRITEHLLDNVQE